MSTSRCPASTRRGDELAAAEGRRRPSERSADEADFAMVMLDNLKVAGVQQAHKEDRITFASIAGWPGNFISAEGRYMEGEQERRAGILIGPEFGTLARPDLVAAAREAGDAGFDVLIACAFNFDAHSAELDRLGRIPVLKARMNPDLHMADALKTTGQGNLFVVFGEPDIEVISGQWLVAGGGRQVICYERLAELPGLGSLEEINSLGGGDLSRFKELAERPEVRVDQPDPPAGGDRPHALRPDEIAEIEALKPSDFPLSLTTNHLTQVTIHGVDVFHPQTGEIRSSGPDGIACWLIDTDYSEESFFVRHAYFLGAADPYRALATTLKAEIDPEAWESLHSDTSRPFDKPESGRIAVKVINHLGDEVMKVFGVA